MTASTSSVDLSFLAELGLEGTLSGAYNGSWLDCNGTELTVTSPADGSPIGVIQQANAEDYEKVAAGARGRQARGKEK